MNPTVADILIESLIEDWGVKFVFGLPGESITGLMESLRVRQDRIQLIQPRHEEAAALMASGYAKLTGQLGVCLGSSGPGGIHLLNGLYDAKLDGVPVLAITGMIDHQRMDTHSYQDVSLDRVFQDVSTYSARLMGPDHLETILQIACRSALSKRGVAHLSIPADFQELAAPRMKRLRRSHSSHFEPQKFSFVTQAELEAAADLLNSGRKIAILAGQGALGASDELLTLAELLGAPIVKSIPAKGCIPDDSAYSLGCLGLIGTLPAKHAMERCDTLIMVGTSFPYSEFLPRSNRVRAIQIDSCAERIGLRYPVEIGLRGDTAAVLRALTPLVGRNQNLDFLEALQEEMSDWWKNVEAQGRRVSLPLKPQVPVWELGRRLSPQAIVTCDSGTSLTWLSRHIQARKGQQFSISGALGTMGSALPTALAAQLAYPDREVVAITGDGSLAMCMAELSTCVKYQLPVKILVLKNNRFGLTHWEQKVLNGHTAFGCELQTINFSKIAEACGIEAYSISQAEPCGKTLELALSHRNPALIECTIDPEEFPTPDLHST